MTVYSVYEPAATLKSGEELDVEQRADKVAFVKEGFSWLALIVPILWLIYQRMWLELFVFLAIFLSLPLIFGTDPSMRELSSWISLALTVVFAFEANDLRGWALRRRGFSFAGTSSGRDRVEAETRFFSDWLPEQDLPRPAVPVVTPVPAAAGANLRASSIPRQSRHGENDVIGSFPRS